MQANRNSQTTSTKCQYQAANSKPRCCVGVNWPASARNRQTIRNVVPMMTFTPWKPVAMKNAAPYILPEKWNAAWAYSQPCTQVKVRPSAIVQTSPQTRPLRLFSSSAWCAQVTVVPEVSRISVLSSGKCQGSKVWMLFGGHTPPVNAIRPMSWSWSGNSAVLKYAQNQATKNITSEAMNRIMP